MRHSFTVERVVPWSDLNEYQGHMTGRLDGVPVTGRVFVADGDWGRYRPGDVLEVDAHVARDGDVAVVDAGTPPALTHVEGVVHVVVGKVVSRDGERLELDSVMPLDVSLELSPHLRRPIPDVAVGDTIRVEGSLEVDLDPDDD